MPTKIRLAISKESGTSQCRSLGVTCSSEFGDDTPTIPGVYTFQQAVHRAAMICRETLPEESVRQT